MEINSINYRVLGYYFSERKSQKSDYSESTKQLNDTLTIDSVKGGMVDTYA